MFVKLKDVFKHYRLSYVIDAKEKSLTITQKGSGFLEYELSDDDLQGIITSKEKGIIDALVNACRIQILSDLDFIHTNVYDASLTEDIRDVSGYSILCFQIYNQLLKCQAYNILDNLEKIISYEELD